jgi:hypothetical protein
MRDGSLVKLSTWLTLNLRLERGCETKRGSTVETASEFLPDELKLNGLFNKSANGAVDIRRVIGD